MPGCSLSASRPQQALQAYQHLQSIYDEPVGLLLTCCGKPTKYLKQPRLYRKRFHHLENKITQSGADEIITACQNCLQVLRQGNPQFKVSSLWTCLAEQGLPETSKFISQTPVTCHVQDSCATRQYPEVKQSARHLMTRLGVKYVEVDDAKGQILCCGQGELMGSSVSDPASFLRKRASRFDKHPVMTYCAGCQEAVQRGGQSSHHLLDLIFPDETGNSFPVSQPPSLLTKWKNRRLFTTEAVLMTVSHQLTPADDGQSSGKKESKYQI